MNPILIAVCVISAIGLLGGALLVIGSKVFAVTKDERAEEVELALPGANCGACGYAGCSAYAKAVAEGAPVNQCLAGGAAVAEKIAAIMGVEAGAATEYKAMIACQGDTAHTKNATNITAFRPALPAMCSITATPPAPSAVLASVTVPGPASLARSRWWTAWRGWTSRNAPAAVPARVCVPSASSSSMPTGSVPSPSSCAPTTKRAWIRGGTARRAVWVVASACATARCRPSIFGTT